MKQIVFIPHWVQETLNRHKLPLVAVLDFEVVRKFLSAQDMAGTIALAQYEGKCYSAQNWDGWSPLVDIWRQSCAKDNVEELNRVEALRYDESIRNDVRDRLFSVDVKEERYNEPFNTYDLSPTTVGVVIYPGHFVEGEVSEDNSLKLIESILRVFYAYEPHSVVAQYGLFKQYLQLLSSRTLIV